jgi:hypothetical protein
MPRRRNGASSSGQSYHSQLRQAMSQFLPHSGLPLLCNDGRVRWTSRLMAMTAVFMVWSPCRTLLDRLAEARQAVVRIYPTRRRPGRSHEGFSKALARHGTLILAALADHWRRCVRQIAGRCWEEYGWVVFGVDGTTFDCPRTAANERVLGLTGWNSQGPPQQRLTCLFHVASGLLWSWVRGGFKQSSERCQLRQMLPLLPENSLLLTDAGFHGYDMVRLLLDRGGSFLMRVGGNMKLLTKLGYAVREQKQTVYLWPLAQQGRAPRKKPWRHRKGIEPPLVLRLIRLTDSKGRPMCLLTNVLKKKRLSDSAAARLYRLRWGVEVMWRDLKQTMGHRKMLSGSPERVAAELDWTMAGQWLLQLISVARMMESKQPPRQYSPAESLRVLRRAMSGRQEKRRSLKTELREAVMDDYRRRRPKQARHILPKQPHGPLGVPVARMATRAEKQLAQRLLAHPPPEPLAA